MSGSHVRGQPANTFKLVMLHTKALVMAVDVLVVVLQLTR